MILLGGLLTAAAGTAAGSYVGTAALRATRGQSATFGRSSCDGCRRVLSAWETLPLLSYAAARGGCRTCGERISPLHPAAEAAGGVVGLSLWFVPAWPQAALMATLAATLLAASVIDARTLRLPNALTAVAAACALALGWTHGPQALTEGAIVAAAAVVLLGGLRWAFAALGRDPGLGLGDVKLIAALALWLGVLTPWMVAGAALLALAFILFVRPRYGRIAFGPMLALAGWACGIGWEAGWWPA